MSDPTDSFAINEDDRFDSLRLIPWWDQKRLSAAKVLVIGAGALGNEAIKNLTLMGIGNIAVVDMDSVEASNLSRSVLFRQRDAGKPKAEVVAAAARDIDPKVNIIPIHANVISSVGLGWFADADCVLGCLDNREARLWVNRCCWHVGTPWIDAGIQEISGVVQLFQPPDGTCYECGMKTADYRLINLRYSCPLLREEDIRKGRVPTTPTIASIIAGWQVQELLKLIHNLPAAESTARVFHGMTNHVYQTKLPRRDDCLSHDPWPTPITLDNINSASTLGDLATTLKTHFNSKPNTLCLRRDLLTSLHCAHCNTTQNILQLRSETAAKLGHCPACRQTMSPNLITQVSLDDEDFLQRTLGELGIPAADIFLVEFEDQCHAIRLNEATFEASDLDREPSEHQTQNHAQP